MPSTEDFLERIGKLLVIANGISPTPYELDPNISEIFMGTVNIATALYGVGSPQLEFVKALTPKSRDQSTDLGVFFDGQKDIVSQLQGVLESFRGELKSGLVKSIQAEAKGEVLADFVVMAKQAMENDVKDVGAVLACAALEDTLKRHAELNGIDVDDRNMSEVISALKARGLVKGAQGKVLQSFTTVRNNAFHAQWDKIESAEVQSVIAFVENFVSEKF